MNTKNQITHDGHIAKIENGILYVRIIANSGCVSCTAKSSCSVSEIEEKIVEVNNTGDKDYKVGNSVVVALNQSHGLMAVFIGYILPFFVLLFTLILVLELSDNEGIAGLTALAMLIPYYLLVYVFRKQIRNRFSFRLV